MESECTMTMRGVERGVGLATFRARELPAEAEPPSVTEYCMKAPNSLRQV